MRYLLVLALLLPLLMPQMTNSAFASSPVARVDEVVVTNSRTEVLLFFRVFGAITPEMEQGVRSGLPLTFTFFVELERLRPGWLNQSLVSLEFNRRLSYDMLRDEYLVLRGEKGARPSTAVSLAEASQLMTTVSDLAIFPLAKLTHGQTYVLRIKVRMVEKKWPLGLGRLLPFRRFWNFETNWQSVEFRY